MEGMLPFDITICGEPEIAGTVNGHTYAVSIMDPGMQARFPAALREDHILRLNFHDLDRPLPANHPSRLAWERRGFGIVLPDERHVRAILEFGARIEPKAKVLIHCMAGISRSTAAAWIIGAQAAPGREAEVLGYIRQIRPQALPNRRMVRIADEMLGAEGRMARLRG
jgi:predicted protein tyrosine phosphatase